MADCKLFETKTAIQVSTYITCTTVQQTHWGFSIHKQVKSYKCTSKLTPSCNIWPIVTRKTTLKALLLDLKLMRNKFKILLKENKLAAIFLEKNKPLKSTWNNNLARTVSMASALLLLAFYNFLCSFDQS
jgi:hypothetical protein